MRIHISEGNEKMGLIHSVSLDPERSCPSGVPCRGKCYAIRLLGFRKAFRDGVLENFMYQATNLIKYFEDIEQWLIAHPQVYFRFHVAGDIPSDRYWRGMCWLALRVPNTKFLAFTKRHAYCQEQRPDNLILIASMWPGWGDPAGLIPGRKAWYESAKSQDSRKPGIVYTCPGHCPSCGYECWEHRIKTDILFVEKRDKKVKNNS